MSFQFLFVPLHYQTTKTNKIMKNYQLWSFTYLAQNTTGMNVLTGDFEESNIEVEIPCFNGRAYFKVNGKYYIACYPKINKLKEFDKEKIEEYCGYIPESGEYGVICGALATIIECDENTFNYYAREFPLKKKDWKRLEY